MNVEHLVTMDNAFVLHPPLVLLFCYVSISSSPSQGLVLLDMYHRNPNHLRINSLLAIHFSFCQTMRGREDPFAKSENLSILGLPCPSHCPRHSNKQKMAILLIVSIHKGLCFKWLWMTLSSIYSRYTL